jgi:hypothetical protein
MTDGQTPAAPHADPLHDLRSACLGIVNALAPLVPGGGDAFDAAVGRLLGAWSETRTLPFALAWKRARPALLGAWAATPDAFPGEAEAAAWAMHTRPEILGIVARGDAHALTVPEAPVPKARNMRRVYDALEGGRPMTRPEIAERCGLWRGSANRTIGRLLEGGFLVPDGNGVRRA